MVAHAHTPNLVLALLSKIGFEAHILTAKAPRRVCLEVPGTLHHDMSRGMSSPVCGRSTTTTPPCLHSTPSARHHHLDARRLGSTTAACDLRARASPRCVPLKSRQVDAS